MALSQEELELLSGPRQQEATAVRSGLSPEELELIGSVPAPQVQQQGRSLPQRFIEDPISATGRALGYEEQAPIVNKQGRDRFMLEQEAANERITARRQELGVDDANPAMRAWSDLASGAAGTVGASAEYIGRQAGWQWLERFGQGAQEEAAALKPTNANLVDDVLAGFGSVITFAVPGGGAAAVTLKSAQMLLTAGRIGPAAAAALTKMATPAAAGLSSALESAGVAQEAFDSGMAEHGDAALAEKRALIAGLASMPLVYLTDKLGIFGDTSKALKAFGMTFATEALQEGGQRILTNWAGYQPLGEGAAYDALIGGLAGGGIKGVQLAAERFAARNVQPDDTGGKDLAIDPTRPMTAEEVFKAAEVNPNMLAALALKADNLNEQDATALAQRMIQEGHQELAANIARVSDTAAFEEAGDRIEAEIPQLVRQVDAAIESYIRPQQQIEPVPAQPGVAPVAQPVAQQPLDATAPSVVGPSAGSPQAAVDQRLTQLTAAQFPEAEQATTAEQPAPMAAEPVVPEQTPALQGQSRTPSIPQEQLLGSLLTELNRVTKGQVDETSIAIATPSLPQTALAKAVKWAFDTDILYVESDGIRLRDGRSFQTGAFLGKNLPGVNAIVVNLKRAEGQPSIRNTIGHELTHQLEIRHPKIYKTLQDVAKQRIAKGAFKGYERFLSRELAKEIEAAGRTMGPEEFKAYVDAELGSEITAEVVGEMWEDKGFWLQAFQMAPSSTFVQQLVGTVKSLLDRLQRAFISTGYVRGVGDIGAMRKAVTSAFQQWEQEEAKAKEAEVQKTEQAKGRQEFADRLGKELAKPTAPQRAAIAYKAVAEKTVPPTKTTKQVIEKVTGVKRPKPIKPLGAGFQRYKSTDIISPRIKVGDGFAYRVLREGKVVGHISGFERDGAFHMYKTELSDESAKGTGIYRRAVQAVADLYPNGLFVHEWEASAALRKSLAKMPTYRKVDDRLVIEPIKPVGAGFQREVTKEGHTIVGTTGKLVGSPGWVTTPKQLDELRQKLKKYFDAGQPARYWYENSSKAILDMFNGDKVTAEKFVALLAIYSQDAAVAGNTTMALNAYYQWLNGQPIKVHYGAQDKKAQALLDKGEYWSGIKTNNFYINLMAEIDPGKITDEATMDVWMKRAFGYATEGSGFGPAQYGFMLRETQRLAKEMGWTPHQAQAAIWTGIKSETEGTQPETAGYSFADALNDRLAQISWEAQPGETVGVLPGLQTAPIEQKFEYFNAIHELLYSKDGKDLIADKIGLPHGKQVTGYSAWKGNIGAGGQVFLPVRLEGQDSKRKVGENSKRLLNLYSALKGYILSQESVVWHHPIYHPAKKHANGIDLMFERALTYREMQQLYGALHDQFGRWDIAPGFTPNGARILNFPGVTGINNKDFQSGMSEVISSLPKGFGDNTGQIHAEAYRSDGDYVSNDWEQFPDGREYVQRWSQAGTQDGTAQQPDLQAWADGIRAGVEAVNRTFSEKYGWGEWRQPQSRAPVEQAPQAAEDRLGFQRQFYSALDRNVEGLSMQAAPAAGWAGTIQGLVNKGLVKQDELQWTGVLDWLKLQSGKVTKQQITDYLKANGVQVTETTLGTDTSSYRDYVYNEVEKRLLNQVEDGDMTDRAMNEILSDLNRRLDQARTENDINDALLAAGMGQDFVNAAIDGARDNAEGLPQAPRYETWQLPGGKNYREIVFTMPGDDYESTHFPGIKGYNGHMRVNERVDADGNRVFFIEEFQNDRAQKGKREGFATGKEAKNFSEFAAREGLSEAEQKRIWKDQNDLHGTDLDLWRRWQGELKRYAGGVPSAPFAGKTEAWVALMLKRAIMYAADKGFTRIAWTTGDQQAARYDLSKQVSKIDVEEAAGENLGKYLVSAYDLSGRKVIDKMATAKELPDLIGKELGQKAIEQASKARDHAATFSGLDLKVGGEGMKAFYDRIVPNVANDVLKKVGGERVGEVGIQTHKPENLLVVRGLGDRYVVMDEDNRYVARLGEGNSPHKFVDVVERAASFPSIATAQKAIQSSRPAPLVQPGFDITPQMLEKTAGGIAQFQRQQPIQGTKYNLPEETRLDVAQKLLQDKEARIAKVQAAVGAQGGTVDEASNIYRAIERYYGASAFKLEQFKKKTVEPLLERIGSSGIETGDIALYMYAKHAPERNAWIAAINPLMPDGGSGMTNAEAAQILKTFQGDPQLPQIQQFAKELWDINRSTQNELLKSGDVTPGTVAGWNSRSPNYVPLQGFENIDELGQRGTGTGVGFDVRSPAARRAKGRESRAGQIVENIIFNHEKAIIRAEKNKVGKALLNFILQNPDNALWQVNKMQSMPQFYKNGTVNVHGLLDGEVRYLNQTVQNPEQTIIVRHYGKEYAIWIKDAAMLEALKGDGGLMSAGEESAKAYTRAWQSVNRTLSKAWTAWNPVFTTINFTRDFVTGMIHAANIGGTANAARIATDLFPMMKGIWDVERNKNENTTGAKWYMQYQEDGGKTGFYVFGDMEERIRNINTLVANARKGVGVRQSMAASLKAIHAIENTVMDYNAIVENAIRVAAYKNAIEQQGMSRAEASSFAKNLTVNFNRKGQLTPKFAAWYLFFNPSVQGVARMAQAAKNNRREFAVAIGSMVAMGIMFGLLGADDKDEEGMPYWDRIPGYEKQRSLILMTGGGNRWTIPMPYGYGYFVSLGYGIADLIRGRPTAGVAMDQLNSITQHFSPLGGGDDPLVALLPTVATPFAEQWANKRTTGQPLMPDEEKISGMPIPDSERYWGATRGTAVQQFTEWLNEATGGTKVSPGAVSVSPETIKNYIRFATGGAGTFLTDALESAYVSQEIDFEAAREKNIVPFLRQWYRYDGVRDDVAYYSEAKKQALTALEEFKKYHQTDRPEVLERLQRNKGIAQLGASIRHMEQAMRNLRLQEIAIMENKALSTEEKYRAKQQLDDQKERLLEQWNAKFYESELESRR